MKKLFNCPLWGMKDKARRIKERARAFAALDGREKLKRVTELVLDNAMVIIILIAIFAIAIMRPRFLSA